MEARADAKARRPRWATWRRAASAQWNYRWAMVHEVAMNLGLTLADPATVVPVLLQEFRASNTVIGLLPSIRYSGWLLPQLFAAGYLQSKERKAPYVIALDLARAASYVVIALLLMAHRRLPDGLVIALFLLLFGFTRITAGSAMVGRFDVVGKVVPRERMAAFFATRGIWTGVCGFAAGVVITAVLGSSLGFPLDYAVLFLASTVVFAVGALTFSLVGEPAVPAQSASRSPLSQLGQIPAIIRGDPLYRRYVVYRLLLEVMGISVPFYIVYAIARWQVPVAMTGTYIAAGTAASLFANFYWRRLAQRRGNGSVITRSVLLSATVPVIPLALVLAEGLGLTGLAGWVASAAFLVLYLVQGAGNSGREICNNAVLINLAPEAQRPTYVGLTNTVAGLFTFAPVLAGRLIDERGYEVLFVLTLIISLLTWVAARRVAEPPLPLATGAGSRPALGGGDAAKA
ncbi:MAG: MFS transporter [Anaerolineae bacterium]